MDSGESGAPGPQKLASLKPPSAPAEKAPEKPPDKPHDKPVRLSKGNAKPPPKPPEPAVLRARRDLLLAAVRARAPSLRPCVPGDAVDLRVPVRLHVGRAGPVRQVEFAADPPAREVRDCVQRIVRSWNFKDVELPGDVELFATLALSPGA